MYAYTGLYKKHKITIMASGMGIPSMGIYSYELFKFYNVEKIIRIGSCGALVKDLNLFDIIISENVYTESNYALTLNNDNTHLISSDSSLNATIINSANKLNINLIKGNTVCTDCFDPYITNEKSYIKRMPSNIRFIGSEMESFALFYNAKLLNKKASCLMTVVDTPFKEAHATSEERLKGLDKMIKIALESILL